MLGWAASWWELQNKQNFDIDLYSNHMWNVIKTYYNNYTSVWNSYSTYDAANLDYTTTHDNKFAGSGSPQRPFIAVSLISP